MKYTKKEIRTEYDCMESVKGSYPEADNNIVNAIIRAEDNLQGASKQDIIDEAYDILNQ